MDTYEAMIDMAKRMGKGFMLELLIKYQELHQIDEEQHVRELGLSQENYARLALCKVPKSYGDIIAIAGYVGLPTDYMNSLMIALQNEGLRVVRLYKCVSCDQEMESIEPLFRCEVCGCVELLEQVDDKMALFVYQKNGNELSILKSPWGWYVTDKRHDSVNEVMEEVNGIINDSK